MIEGIICAILIVPLFCLLGGRRWPDHGASCAGSPSWPKPTISCILLLPLIGGSFNFDARLPQTVDTVERTTIVDASRATVWKQILDASDIRPAEIDSAWLFRIGVPLPLEGRLQADGVQTTRRVRMAKDVYFDEVIEEQREHEFVRWTYRFYEDSFPPYALDEHVVIGGHYFDVLDTSYTLRPRGDATELTVRLSYRISTTFNWYARPLMQLLLGDLAERNLGYYRQRSEVVENRTDDAAQRLCQCDAASAASSARSADSIPRMLMFPSWQAYSKISPLLFFQ